MSAEPRLILAMHTPTAISILIVVLERELMHSHVASSSNGAAQCLVCEAARFNGLNVPAFTISFHQRLVRLFLLALSAGVRP